MALQTLDKNEGAASLLGDRRAHGPAPGQMESPQARLDPY